VVEEREDVVASAATECGRVGRFIAVWKILTVPRLHWVALRCARIGHRSGARAWFGPWWRTGALADGSRHGADVVGPVAPLGCAGCGGPAPCLFVNWLLWSPTQCCAHG
jgi:hypothetical protein